VNSGEHWTADLCNFPIDAQACVRFLCVCVVSGAYCAHIHIHARPEDKHRTYSGSVRARSSTGSSRRAPPSLAST
jgi:hypothetical protein